MLEGACLAFDEEFLKRRCDQLHKPNRPAMIIYLQRLSEQACRLDVTCRVTATVAAADGEASRLDWHAYSPDQFVFI